MVDRSGKSDNELWWEFSNLLDPEVEEMIGFLDKPRNAIVPEIKVRMENMVFWRVQYYRNRVSSFQKTCQWTSYSVFSLLSKLLDEKISSMYFHFNSIKRQNSNIRCQWSLLKTVKLEKSNFLFKCTTITRKSDFLQPHSNIDNATI